MRSQALITAAFIAATAGCRDETPTSPVSQLPVIEALSSTSIEGVVGETAPVAPAIRITDRGTGKPLANVAVNFVPNNGGAVTNGRVVTDSLGIARCGEWRFGTQTGLAELSVWAFGGPRGSFRVTLKPGAPAPVNPPTADEFRLVGDSRDVWLNVTDRFYNAIPLIEVQLRTIGPSGHVSEAKVTADAFGTVIVKDWALDSLPGVNKLTLSANGVELRVLRVTGIDPATVKWYSLEELRMTDKAVPPKNWGIVEGRIGFTSFDGCICLRAEGAYIRILKYFDGSSSSWSGTYRLQGKTLTSTSLAWDKGIVDGDEISIDAWDPYDGEWWLTWIYRSMDKTN